MVVAGLRMHDVRGDTTIDIIGGDSGSPLYRKWSYGGEYWITPIGTMSTDAGAFGRVKDAQDTWGFTIVIS